MTHAPRSLSPNQQAALTIGKAVSAVLLIFAVVSIFIASQGDVECRQWSYGGDCLDRHDSTQAPLIVGGVLLVLSIAGFLTAATVRRGLIEQAET
ncbi:hypothetical protein ACWEKT_07585 [Nocardia takedensis]|uniref:hypothetical protein n=1 Tax=Nocardia takedensis TaxID=259390 RepID=UPI0012F6E68D|nr:hypothetical protein [Nocardia takedensis]